MEYYILLEKLLNIPDLKIHFVEESTKMIEIFCGVTTPEVLCPNCGCPCTKIKQKTAITLRDLNISEKEVYLHLTKRQFVCGGCGANFTERLDWAEPGKSYTKRFSKFVFELCLSQNFQSAACVLNVNSKKAERIFYDLAKKAVRIDEKWMNVRYLGIDEISNRKGRGEYCCVLVNLETGEEIDILPDRKLETILQYFCDLKEEVRSKIEGIASDMWDAYASVAQSIFPNAVHVIDRFHVVKSLNICMNETLKQVRQSAKETHAEQAKTSKEPTDFECLKNLRWSLSKRPENCSNEDLDKLQIAFKRSEKLAKIYNLRNAFNSYFDLAPSELWLKNQLEKWQQLVEIEAPDTFRSFLKTLNNWKTKIVNFATKRITNAATEGLNNVIRQIKRMSYGMYNFEHLRLRILARYA